MSTYRNLFISVSLVILASVCLGQEHKSAPVIKTGAKTVNPATPKIPYIAEVVGTSVYVRSGPGTAYYFCSKLASPERVKVVGHSPEGLWTRILPPDGSFSWISMNFVKLDTVNPGIGVVSGDAVRVWAGSEYEVPVRSSTMQVKLDKGALVKLMDGQKATGDYYKIAPPTGAYLWMSTQYLKYVGPITPPKPLKLPPKPTAKPEPAPSVKPQPAKPPVKEKPKAPPEPPKPPKLSAEAKMVKECLELAEKLLAESAKPIGKQDYSAIKKTLQSIAKNPEAGKAKFYAEYQLDRISRFELAHLSWQEVKRQDDELAKTRKGIKKERSVRLENLPKPEDFIVTGRIKPSQIYTAQTGQERYLIVSEAGRIICYAIPANAAAGADIARHLNSRVGLIGELDEDKTGPIGLVKFTAIKSLSALTE